MSLQLLKKLVGKGTPYDFIVFWILFFGHLLFAGGADAGPKGGDFIFKINCLYDAFL